MANLPLTPTWEEAIYLIATSDPVVGGLDGISNIQGRQLGNRTEWLKAQVKKVSDVVQAFEPSTQEALSSAVQLALDLAGLAGREIWRSNHVRQQEIEAIIINRGIKSGVLITKSSSATRNISVSDGTVFMGGRLYPVLSQTNTASVASNSTGADGLVILYMFLTVSGAIDIAATVLNGAMPDGAIELARAVVPAGNTEANDPYLDSVTISDSARREPGWPQIQQAPARVTVPLNYVLPDNGYLVATEVLALSGSRYQIGDLSCEDRLTNGFKLQTSGSADNIKVRMRVQHPGI